MEMLQGLINLDPALIGKVLPIMLLINGCLAGLAMILNAVVKFTKSSSDDKAGSIANKVVGYSQKLVDILMGNVKH
jgi:hypothetical protein